METTLFLAKFWGWLLVIISLGFLFRKKTLREEIFRSIEEKNFSLFFAFFFLILSLPTLILHNLWVKDWRVLITILGWLFLIKGFLRFIFPEIFQRLFQILRKRILLTQLILIIFFILGAWLLWMSRL